MTSTKHTDIDIADVRIGDTISYNRARNAKRSVGKVLEIKRTEHQIGSRTEVLYAIDTDASYISYLNDFEGTTVRLIERAPEVEVEDERTDCVTCEVTVAGKACFGCGTVQPADEAPAVSTPKANARDITAAAITKAPEHVWATKSGPDSTFILRITGTNPLSLDAHLHLLDEVAAFFNTTNYGFHATVDNTRSGFGTPSYAVRIVDLVARKARIDEQAAKRAAALAKALAELEAATPTDANGVPVLFEV